jgi:hypothetical protein
MRIGRLVRKLLLQTEAPFENPASRAIELPPRDITRCNRAKCFCASACFFIWASGIYGAGDQLFIHQPYFDPALFGKLPPTEAMRQHQEMISSARQCLREMDTPDSVFTDLMVATPPRSAQQLDSPMAYSLFGYIPSMRD